MGNDNGGPVGANPSEIGEDLRLSVGIYGGQRIVKNEDCWVF